MVQTILSKLLNAPLTIGNAETGDTYPLPPQVAVVIKEVLARVAVSKEKARSETPSELTPNEAADVLNVSRMYVMKLIQEGTLPSRMVGSHHRLPYANVAAYKEQQRARSRSAMEDVYAIDREGGDPFAPPPDKSVYRSKGGRNE